MNREILFRGKADTDEVDLNEISIPHENGWVTGNLVCSKGSYYIIGEIEDVTEEYFHPSFWIPVIPNTVGQFTGLTDKNGTKIFEGDVMKWECGSDSVNVIVVFQDGKFGGRIETYNHISHHIDLSYLQITGTIHDNPTP